MLLPLPAEPECSKSKRASASHNERGSSSRGGPPMLLPLPAEPALVKQRLPVNAWEAPVAWKTTDAAGCQLPWEPRTTPYLSA
jgi:hypothetical protein